MPQPLSASETRPGLQHFLRGEFVVSEFHAHWMTTAHSLHPRALAPICPILSASQKKKRVLLLSTLPFQALTLHARQSKPQGSLFSQHVTSMHSLDSTLTCCTPFVVNVLQLRFEKVNDGAGVRPHPKIQTYSLSVPALRK